MCGLMAISFGREKRGTAASRQGLHLSVSDRGCLKLYVRALGSCSGHQGCHHAILQLPAHALPHLSTALCAFCPHPRAPVMYV